MLPIVRMMGGVKNCANGDDFSGNLDLWTIGDIFGPNTAAASKDGSELSLAYTSAYPGGPNSSFKFMYNAIFTGDLDIQIDWDIIIGADTGITGWFAGLGMRLQNDNLWRQEMTMIGNLTQHQKIEIKNGSQSVANLATTQTNGKYKILRHTSNLWATQYWTGTQWNYLGGTGVEYTGDSGGDPVEVYAYIVQKNNFWPVCQMNFDNFIINAAGGITCT